MDIFQQSLNNCKKCPYEDYDINWYDEKTGCGKLGVHIYPESDNSVMIVGQNPSHRRWEGVHSMSGKQGDIFREIFGINHLVFTNFIQVSTPDNKVDKLSDSEIIHCFQHLLYEINSLKPKVIIFCSSFAKNKIKELNLIITFKTKIFFVNHPDYYYTYKRGNISEYRFQLESIRNSIKNEQKQ
jgi:uracil-DNA glycosylase family 4